ncbi:MAG: DUF2357 domain-containing protein [Bacteroidota bacterium]
MPRCFRLYTDTFELVWSARREQRSDVALRLDIIEGDDVQLDLTDGVGALREETTYTVLVKSNAPVVLTHQHPGFFGSMSTADGGCIAHGTVNFGSQVGYSDISLLVGGTVACTFRVEVYPSKIDYQRDYVALRDAVSSLHADLALGYLQRTYQRGRVGADADRGLLGWVFILRSLVDDLTAAVQHIARQPHQRAERVAMWKAQEHIRSHEAPSMLPPLWRSTFTRSMRPSRYVQTEHTTRTTTLWEHEWLHSEITSFAERLGSAEHAYKNGSTDKEHRLWKEIRQLQVCLYDLAAELPGATKRISAAQPHRSSPLFERAPGYREAYWLCNVLQRSLDLRGGPIPFEVKDIHQLYEYWCYLTVVRTVADIIGVSIPFYELIALRDDRLPVRLWQGRQQTLTFDLGARGALVLAYNPRYGGPAYLVPQQPDIVLTLQPTSGTTHRYILDAKYRLDASPGYIRRYGAPGPPRDALNDLHRYRDALREHNGAYVQVEQAIALFPYHNTSEYDFTASRLRHAIQDRGLGALPMLPNNTGHLEQWLQHVLSSLPG